MKYFFLILIFILTGCNVLTMLGEEQAGIKGDPFRKDYSSKNYYLNLNFPNIERDFYLLDEDFVRTVTIEAPSEASLSCSHDNGATWESCTGDTIIWDSSDYNIYHQVKAVMQDGHVETQSFRPSLVASGVSFGNCDETVTADEPISTFNGRLATSKTICLADGVTISNAGSDGAISPGGSTTITLYARKDTNVELINAAQASIPVVQVNSGTTMNIYGVRILNTMAPGNGVNADSTTKIVDSYIEVQDTTNSSNALNSNGANTVINILSSEFKHSSLNNGGAISVGSSDLYIKNSTIKGGYQAIYFYSNIGADFTLSIEDSQIYAEKTNNASTSAPGGIEFWHNGGGFQINFDISNSTLISRGGPMIVFDEGAGEVYANINNVSFQRTGDTNSDSPAIYIADTTGTNTLNFSSDSFVCNHTSTSTALFDSIVNNAGGTGLFNVLDMNAHTSNTDISICPSN